MNIKSKLIHLLGGITQDELQSIDSYADERYNSGVHEGRFSTLVCLKIYADSLFGIDADRWCKSMYDFIVQGIEDLNRDDISIENTKAEPRK